MSNSSPRHAIDDGNGRGVQEQSLQPRPKSAPARLFVPDLPTLWPGMLVRGGSAARAFPFSARHVGYYYFARIAVWHTVKMLGLEGGKVLAPAYHHGVEIEALIAAGANVTFYRVGPGWEVDLDDVKRRISPDTRALYLTHFAGFPGPTAEMRALADRHNLPLIEDCALSLFSSDGRVPLGTAGDFSIFCLYKTLPVPNGGVLAVNESARRHIPHTTLRAPYSDGPPATSTLSHLASSLLKNTEMRGGKAGRLLRSAVRRLGKRTVEVAGIERVTTGSDHFNPAHIDIGMSALSRRIVAAQDPRRIVSTRRRNYLYLAGELGQEVPPLFAHLPSGVCPLFYPLAVEDKEHAVAELEAEGIGAVDFWRYSHPACDLAQFPDVARLRATILEVPCHQDISLATMKRVARAVKGVLRKRRW